MRFNSLVLFTDGGSRGNPGHAAFGLVLYASREKLEYLSKEPNKIHSYLTFLEDQKHYLGSQLTNNEAEWHGLLAGLELAKKYADYSQNLRVYLDSELVVKQLLGEYKVRKPELKSFFDQAQKLRANFTYLEFIHIRRELNQYADQLVNSCLDDKLS